MNQSKISVRYAKALFLFAKEKNMLDAIKDDITSLAKALATIPEMADFIVNPVATTSWKKIFFKALLEEKMKQETLKFIDLVVDNKREMYLADIARNFLDMYKKSGGIKTVTLTGTSEFSVEQKKKVTAFVEENFRTKVDLEEKVDKDILGGFILRIDDRQFDASVASKLKEIKKDLLETNL